MMDLWELEDKKKRLLPRVQEIHERNTALHAEMDELSDELDKIHEECKHQGTLAQPDDDYVFSRGENKGRAYFCAGCGLHWVIYFRSGD